MKLLQWNHVSFLKNRKYLEFLKLVEETSDRKRAIAALLHLVEDDMGYLLFRAVERAKRALATCETALIAEEEYALTVSAEIGRAQFAQSTIPLVDQIIGTAKSVLAAGSTSPSGVDAVFLTGGTSLIAHVRQAFAVLFGPEKLRARQTFTSVVDGLARSAASAD